MLVIDQSLPPTNCIHTGKAQVHNFMINCCHTKFSLLVNGSQIFKYFQVFSSILCPKCKEGCLESSNECELGNYWIHDRCDKLSAK